jgi:hypothetical protein
VSGQDGDGNPIFSLAANGKPTSWGWSDDEPFVGLLAEAGYVQLDETEMKRLNHILFNSLSSPNGFVMKQQGREIDVVDAHVQYYAGIDSSKPLNKWIEPTSLTRCGSS